MSWAYVVVDTLTGVVQAPVVPASFSFDRAINSSGKGRATFLGGTVGSALLTPWSRTIVASRNGVAVGAGLIISTTADVDANMWTVEFADVRSILGRRTTFGSNGYSGNLTVNNSLPLLNQSLVSMPQWLIWSGTEGPTANYGLPIYIPEGLVTYGLIAGLPKAGSESRTYIDYEVRFVDEALDELQGAGLEIDFEPRWSAAGNLEWLMRVGTALTGSTFEWNMTAPNPRLFGVKVTKDSAKQSNVVYSIGKGSEMDMRVTTSSAAPSGPALERAENYKDIDDMGVLQTHSNANLALYNRPTEQWSLSIFAGDPAVETMRLGSTLRLYFSGHPMVSDGWHDLRMIGFSADESEKITIDVQPIGA